MNQRKLMGALSIILLAFLFILVGCGDGKDRKTHPRKINAHGKVGGGAGAGSGKTLSLKTAHIKTINDALQSQMDGQVVDMNSLDDGDYTLDSVLGHVKFIRVSGDEVAAVASAQIISNSLSSPVTDKEGLIATDTDEGRDIEIPTRFTVSNKSINLTDLVQVNYHSQLELSGGLRQELTAANGSGPSLLKSLNGTMNSVGTYPLAIAGKDAGIQIRKTATGVRFVVTITEKKAGNTAKQGDSTLIRTLVFTFSLKAKAQAAPSQQTTEQTPAAAPAADVAPATDEAAATGTSDFRLVSPDTNVSK